MTTLAAILITALSLIEVYCIIWLAQYVAEYVAERSEQRRERFRVLAYSAVRERRIKNQNRATLWRGIEK